MPSRTAVVWTPAGLLPKRQEKKNQRHTHTNRTEETAAAAWVETWVGSITHRCASSCRRRRAPRRRRRSAVEGSSMLRRRRCPSRWAPPSPGPASSPPPADDRAVRWGRLGDFSSLLRTRLESKKETTRSSREGGAPDFIHTARASAAAAQSC